MHSAAFIALSRFALLGKTVPQPLKTEEVRYAVNV